MSVVEVRRKRNFHDVVPVESQRYTTYDAQLVVEETTDSKKRFKMNDSHPQVMPRENMSGNPLVDYVDISDEPISIFEAKAENWEDLYKTATKRRGRKNEDDGLVYYTDGEVSGIMQEVIRKYGNRIRELYDEILRQKLSEQLRMFQQFHEEYHSKAVKPTDFSYLS